MKPLLSIQYLRAIAAIGVVAFHTGHATILGQAGVDVFFVISGFIMWMVTARPTTPVQFLSNRVLRVVPIYWIATIIMASHQGASNADVIRSMLFWPYRGADGHEWPVLVQGWTLNYEMFFYLLFAFTLTIPRRLQLRALTAVLCGLAGIGIAFAPGGAAWHTYTNPLLVEFLAGVWLSEIVQRGKYPGFKIALVMVAAGLASFLISTLLPVPQLWRFVIWGVPSLVVVLGAVSIELDHGLPTVKWLKSLGDGSYSIYLFHPFVMKTAAAWLAWPAAVFPLAAGVGAGMVAFWSLEQPITIRLKRWAGHVRFVAVTDQLLAPRTWREFLK